MSLLKTSTFLLFSFLVHFIQFSLGEVEFENSSISYIEKREESSENKRDGFFEIFFVVLGIILFAIFLVILYTMASCFNMKGDNTVIFSIPWTLLDFVLDILFVLRNGKDFPWLYVPSIVFLVGPVIVNFIIAFSIIIREKNNGTTEFRRWFYDNSAFAATATVLSGADISVFKVLYSNLFRLKKFNAPFSDKARTLILWGCVFSSLAEDLPQFIIQVLYKRAATDKLTIIPLLKLITISVQLPIGIVGRIYEALKDHRKPEKTEGTNVSNSNDVEK